MAVERLSKTLTTSLATIVTVLLYLSLADANRNVIQFIYRTFILDYRTFSMGVPSDTVWFLSLIALLSNAILLITAMWFVRYSTGAHVTVPLLVSILVVMLYLLMMNSPDSASLLMVTRIGWEEELIYFRSGWALVGLLCPILGWSLGRRAITSRGT